MPSSSRRVLDIGCSDGTLAHQLRGHLKNVEIVVGAEMDPSMAAQAAHICDEVVVGDVDENLQAGKFEAFGQFDLIICADVLEHTTDPWSVLTRLRGLLTEDGTLVISLPNSRHYSLWASVAFRGVWPYRSRGINDRTHLRFFCLLNMFELATSAELTVSSVHPTYRLVERASRINRVARLAALPLLREHFAFQYVLVMAPSSAGATTDGASSRRVERLIKRAERHTDQLR